MAAYFIPENFPVQLHFPDLTATQVAELIAELTRRQTVIPLPIDGYEQTRIRVLNFGQLSGGYTTTDDDLTGLQTCTFNGTQEDVDAAFARAG